MMMIFLPLSTQKYCPKQSRVLMPLLLLLLHNVLPGLDLNKKNVATSQWQFRKKSLLLYFILLPNWLIQRESNELVSILASLIRAALAVDLSVITAFGACTQGSCKLQPNKEGEEEKYEALLLGMQL